MCREAEQHHVRVKLGDCHQPLNMDIYCVQGTSAALVGWEITELALVFTFLCYQCIKLKNKCNITYEATRVCFISKLSDGF